MSGGISLGGGIMLGFSLFLLYNLSKMKYGLLVYLIRDKWRIDWCFLLIIFKLYFLTFIIFTCSQQNRKWLCHFKISLKLKIFSPSLTQSLVAAWVTDPWISVRGFQDSELWHLFRDSHFDFGQAQFIWQDFRTLSLLAKGGRI